MGLEFHEDRRVEGRGELLQMHREAYLLSGGNAAVDSNDRGQASECWLENQCLNGLESKEHQKFPDAGERGGDDGVAMILMTRNSIRVLARSRRISVESETDSFEETIEGQRAT